MFLSTVSSSICKFLVLVDVLVGISFITQKWVPYSSVSAYVCWKLILPSPDFFSVWRCQRSSLRFKIFVNSCYNNNYCIFFLKTVSDNVRWIQTMSDLFSLKVLGEMLGEFGKCWGNGFGLKIYKFFWLICLSFLICDN